MYNRVGRSLLIVGRQLRQNLCENTINNTNGTIGRALGTILHGRANNSYVFQRNYSNGNSGEIDKDIPVLLTVDEEAAIKLKDFLTTPENERLYKIIQLEIEMLQQNSEKVPNNLRPSHWYELVNLSSRTKRKRYLAFAWGLEKKKENEEKAKLEKRKLREEQGKPIIEDDYRLFNNTMFLRIYDTAINNMYNARLINKILFGQPIVLDCDYENHMTRQEIQACARQMQMSFAANRMHDDPFDMYFCNANTSGGLMKAVHRFIPPLYDPEFPLHIKTESYLDVFDKNRLVYLTPHCHQDMTEFDHDAVYIIGSFVDKSSNEPISMAKAKKEGLKMMKFPLDRYLKWGCSSGKNLTLNAVVNILLDLRFTGSWEKALKHVPQRKLFNVQELAKERRLKRDFNNLSTTMSETEPINPLQPIMPKIDQRFNSDRFSRENYKPSLSGYNNRRESRLSSYSRTDSAGEEVDFSVKGRAKLKKKWNN